VPVVYGLPAAEAVSAAERGEIVLGGCVIASDVPEWSCRRCGHRWYDTQVLEQRRAEYERLRVPAILRSLWAGWDDVTDSLAGGRIRPAALAVVRGGWRAGLRDWRSIIRAAKGQPSLAAMWAQAGDVDLMIWMYRRYLRGAALPGDVVRCLRRFGVWCLRRGLVTFAALPDRRQGSVELEGVINAIAQWVDGQTAHEVAHRVASNREDEHRRTHQRVPHVHVAGLHAAKVLLEEEPIQAAAAASRWAANVAGYRAVLDRDVRLRTGGVERRDRVWALDGRLQRSEAHAREIAAQADKLRDLLGNPFDEVRSLPVH
jgi:hypothetical protein